MKPESRFSDFDFPTVLNDVLREMKFERPTPVQARAIPHVLAGKDVLATAQTGTGKTAAFALPLLARMIAGWKKRVLIVTPTRELAEQIGEVLEQLTKKTPHLKSAVIIGGLAYQRQIHNLRMRPAFVVGTPGRLLDQLQMGHLNLEDFGALVMDEADRMLDMGFEPQIKQLVGHLPSDRQSLMFSATLPEKIVRLAHSFLHEPVRVEIGLSTKPVEKIKQDMVMTTGPEKDKALIREIDKVAGSIIVFTRTKSRTEKVAKVLSEAGHDVVRIHGDRTQNQRSQAIAALKNGSARILVATDIAARGLDIPYIQHVVNYDLPVEMEDYIHRIGRTARAGAEGHAISFVIPEEMRHWARIYKMIHGHYPEGLLKQVKNRTQTGKSGKGAPRSHSGARPNAAGARALETRPSKRGAPARDDHRSKHRAEDERDYRSKKKTKGPATQKWLKGKSEEGSKRGATQAHSDGRRQVPSTSGKGKQRGGAGRSGSRSRHR